MNASSSKFSGITAGCLMAATMMLSLGGPAGAHSATKAPTAKPSSAATRQAHQPIADVDPISTRSAETLPDLSSLQPAAPSIRQELIDTILAQLNAFRDGDFQKASSFASRQLLSNFSSTQDFRLVISRAYPEFTDYKAAAFGEAKTDKSEDIIVVPATLTGEDGVVVQALYVMDKEGASYRVLTIIGGMDPYARDRGSEDDGPLADLNAAMV